MQCSERLERETPFIIAPVRRVFFCLIHKPTFLKYFNETWYTEDCFGPRTDNFKNNSLRHLHRERRFNFGKDCGREIPT